MKAYILSSLLLISSFAAASPTDSIQITADWLIARDPAGEYLKKYSPIAVAEMKRTGIPASIKMAQGMLESDFGRSELARKANNHFGIKCHKDWTGPTFYKMDDEESESCFRSYSSPELSYKAHSDFLTDPKKVNRYGFLFNLKKTDYKGWANGLQKAGYATSQTYASKLIGLIERLKLYELDQKGSAPTPTPAQDHNTLKNLGVNYVIAEADDTPQSIADEHDISIKRLRKYNELTGSRRIKPGLKVWLSSKKRWYRGRDIIYVSEGNETIYEVSQKLGIKVKRLEKLNKLKGEAMLKPQQKIALKCKGARKLYR